VGECVCKLKVIASCRTVLLNYVDNKINKCVVTKCR